MDAPSDPTLVTRGARKLAQRLEGDEETMAWVLARLRERTGATDVAIAARLGLDEELLPHLALCNRPRQELFRTDVESIADHFAIAPRPLADLVREVETLLRFQPRGDRAAGLLAAARDRVAEEEDSYDSQASTSESQPTDEPAGDDE
jgi:hypothetical protein